MTQAQPGFEIVGDVKTQTGPILGGRTGYWFKQVPWYGMGVDVFYFTANNKTQMSNVTVNGFPFGPVTASSADTHAIAVAFDVLRLRVQLLKDEEFRHGRLQPYITAGPAVFFASMKDTDSVNGFTPPNQTASDTSLGIKVAGGLHYQFTPLLGFFSEYRYTHFKTELTGINDSTLGPVATKMNMNTHHVIAGVSFRFN